MNKEFYEKDWRDQTDEWLMQHTIMGALWKREITPYTSLSFKETFARLDEEGKIARPKSVNEILEIMKKEFGIPL